MGDKNPIMELARDGGDNVTDRERAEDSSQRLFADGVLHLLFHRAEFVLDVLDNFLALATQVGGGAQSSALGVVDTLLAHAAEGLGDILDILLKLRDLRLDILVAARRT